MSSLTEQWKKKSYVYGKPLGTEANKKAASIWQDKLMLLQKANLGAEEVACDHPARRRRRRRRRKRRIL